MSVVAGDGYAVAGLDDLGEGHGIRKVRSELGVTAFGVNVIVMPPGYTTNWHFHERQEELYFVHRGTVEVLVGDEPRRERLEAGGFARVDAATTRALHNPGDEDAVLVVVGGADGYVGRDGIFRGDAAPGG